MSWHSLMHRISTDQLVIWLIVGLLAGSLAGMLVKRSKKGFGVYGNLGLGLIGAVVGGLLFEVLGIDLGLGRISISLEDLAAACAGALVFLAGVRLLRMLSGGKGGKKG